MVTRAMEMSGMLNVIKKAFREDIDPTIIELNESTFNTVR